MKRCYGCGRRYQSDRGPGWGGLCLPCGEAHHRAQLARFGGPSGQFQAYARFLQWCIAGGEPLV